jgi:hypothetical protein
LASCPVIIAIDSLASFILHLALMEPSPDPSEPLYATTATEITAQDELNGDTARVVTQGGEAVDHRVEEDGSVRVWPLGRGKRKVKVKQVRQSVCSVCLRVQRIG